MRRKPEPPQLCQPHTIIAKGGLQPLIGLVGLTDVDTQRQAAAA